MKIGKVSESVLKRSILRQLHTKRNEIVSGAGVGADCAIFSLSDTEHMTSCMQEMIVTEVSDVSIALQKCVNNLAVAGATPVAALLTLLLPEFIEEPDIKAMMAEAEKACQSLQMQIAGGQTRITEAVNMPLAVVTGYGVVQKDAYRTLKSAKAGQDIVLSKWIGLEGTASLAKGYRQELLERYPAYLVEEAESFDRLLSIIPEAATAMKSSVCAMHDASEGGIFATLWELAEGAGVGLTVDLKKLPIRQETVEVCEYLGANPYELKSGGCLIMTTEDGLGLVSALESEGIPAVVVGKLTDSNDRIILNEEEVRYMDRPKQDELYKFGKRGNEA